MNKPLDEKQKIFGKDLLGRDIHIGDEVVFFITNDGIRFEKGVVIGETQTDEPKAIIQTRLGKFKYRRHQHQIVIRENTSSFAAVQAESERLREECNEIRKELIAEIEERLEHHGDDMNDSGSSRIAEIRAEIKYQESRNG